MNNSNTIVAPSSGGGGGISSATTPITYTAASFGGLSYRTISTSAKIAYITYGTINSGDIVVDVANSITYNGTSVTFDLGFVPTQNVNIYYYN